MSDIKQEYAASSALTIGLATTPLASSATMVLGRESNSVDNTTTKYLDYLLAGKITTGTTVTVDREIRVYVIGLMEDSTWPDVIDGTDSDETFTDVRMRDAVAKLAAVMLVNATNAVTYWFGPVSVRALFGGNMPKKFVVWVTHNTVAALNSTAGNHAIWITPTYETVV